jgi:hypothetical protein
MQNVARLEKEGEMLQQACSREKMDTYSIRCKRPRALLSLKNPGRFKKNFKNCTFRF